MAAREEVDPRSLLPSDEELEAALRQELQRPQKSSFDAVRGFVSRRQDSCNAVTFWVKYGFNAELLACEANTQEFVHAELAKLDQETQQRFYVPRVYHWVEVEIDQRSYGLIVMEHITGTSIKDLMSTHVKPGRFSFYEEKFPPYKDRVVDAICFLLSLKPPPETGPGPVGGGCMSNLIFGREDPEAPREFDNLEELETYFNEENKKNKPDSPRADFASEGLKLCCCDLNFENFIVENGDDLSSRLIIIDFEMTCFLPHSFLLWALWDKGDKYLSDQVKSRSQLQSTRDNLIAIDTLRLQRAWASLIH